MSDLVARVAEQVPWMQRRADALDRDKAFPTQEFDLLRGIGALSSPLPLRGYGGVDELISLLILAGQGNLSVGRLFEAHVNARHLIGRFGEPAAWHDECLFGLWVTDPLENCLRMRRAGNRIFLSGGKQFCSGAGFVSGVLVTARDPDGEARMLAMSLGIGERVTALPSPLQGMQSTITGSVDFTGCDIPAEALLGQSGDYLREPDFSAGAWRGSAVALGGLISLLDQTVIQLRAAGRLDTPHNQVRLGRAFITRESSRQWVQAAARIAENLSADTNHRVATVGLSRIAVETACLDAMRLVQRSVGLTAFRQGHPIERICRDLATYLRQPAPDEVLTEAAVWFADRPEASA